jgi:FkbM family methyltransferase
MEQMTEQKIEQISEHMIEQIISVPSFLQRIAEHDKPLVLYGMGDGAEKILRGLSERGVAADGIFASDEFVRGQSFAGYQVLTYAEAKRQFGDMAVLVCFGTEQPDVLENIYRIAAEQELYAPHVPLFGNALFDEDFVREHYAELVEASKIWADEQSRAVYADYLQYLWSGRIDCLQRCTTPKDEAWRLLELRDDEIYADLGAYDGDTVRYFCGLTAGKYRQIWAFEPDVKNFNKLQANLADMPETFALNMAAWSSSGQMPFAGKAGRNSALAEDESKAKMSAEVISLDDFQREYPAAPATLLKMDVEGAEEAVLLGGRKLLSEHKPKLAVAAYHRTEDIYRLPLLLKRLNPAYRLFLRHHPYVPGWETNIYAL